jgi:hypothetical protein
LNERFDEGLMISRNSVQVAGALAVGEQVERIPECVAAGKRQEIFGGAGGFSCRFHKTNISVKTEITV